MRRQRTLWLALVGYLMAAAGIILVRQGIPIRQFATAQPKTPPLTSAYADLTEFWRQEANSLNIEPEAGRLQQWNIGYALDGEILYQSFKLYVDRENGTYDVYYYSQDTHNSGQVASWSRQRLKGSIPKGLVPAHTAFATVNQMGLRELERLENLNPPVRFWFFAESGPRTYKPIAGGYFVEGSQFIPIGPEGVIMHGDHGIFGIAEGALTTDGNSATTPTRESPGAKLFVVPLSGD